MEKENKYFEEHFEGFEPTPSLNVWKDLEAGLDKRDSRRKGIYFMRIAAGLALLIVAGWFTWSGLTGQEAPIAESSKDEVEEVIEKKTVTPEKEIKINQSQKTVNKDIKKQPVKRLKKPVKSKSPITNYNMKLADNKAKENADSITTLPENNDIQLAIEENPKEIEIEIEIQEPVVEEKMTLATNETNKSKSKSITIILRPEVHQTEAIAVAEEPKVNLKKFRKILGKDLHKHQIDIGKKPTLAFGKIRINQIKLKNNENDQTQL